jgi:hypothetical protein
MQTLNSVGYARKTLLIAGIGMLMAFLFLAPLAAHAAGSVTVGTDKTYYAGAATITVSGTVSPAPGVTGTNVAITIVGPTNSQVYANQFAVGSTGSYTGTLVAGGTLWNVNGTYTVNANYNGATASSSFQYGNVTTTTSGGKTGTTTTVMVTTTVVVDSAVTTTVVSNVQATTTVLQQSTVTQQATTTVNAQTTTTLLQQQQTTVNAYTTTTVSQTGTDTGLIVGAIGVVIAIIAGAIAVMALRRH